MPFIMAEAIRAVKADELGAGFMIGEAIDPLTEVADYIATLLNIPQIGSAIALLSFGNMIGDAVELARLNSILRRYEPGGFIVMTVYVTSITHSISYSIHNSLFLNDLGERGRFIPMSYLTEEDKDNILAGRVSF